LKSVYHKRLDGRSFEFLTITGWLDCSCKVRLP
jgi:hypothetical protein